MFLSMLASIKVYPNLQLFVYNIVSRIFYTLLAIHKWGIYEAHRYGNQESET